MNWEFSFLYFLQELHNPVLDKIMLFITSLGNEGILWIGIAVVMVFFKKYRKCAISVGVSLLLMELIGNVILKDLIARPRPCWIDPTVELLLKAPSSYSFPSGHTFAGFASAFTIFLHHKKEGIAMLETLTPEDILLEGHRSELTTYKGIMISKENASKDMFKIDLLNMIQGK